jgi:exodeoxyribonuclease VII small subunit
MLSRIHFKTDLISTFPKAMSPMKKKQWSYETAIAKVEEAIAKIESEELDLVSVFENFTTAIEELQKCEQFLTEKQQQMGLLVETLESDSQP